MDTTQDTTRTPLGLRLLQLAVPALAVPSAIGVAQFFSLADGHAGQWTAQGIIAATGFELMNVGLSVLDVRRPALHDTVQRVRFWSVTTAIALNAVAHYGARVPGLDQVDGVGGVLALVASVPLAVLYVALAGLLHRISEGEHAERDALRELRAELAAALKANDEWTQEAARLETQLTRAQVEAREQLAQAREAHAAELARVAAQAREGAEGLAGELAQAREELARVSTQAREGSATHAAELARVEGEAREAQARAQAVERERVRVAREVEQLREKVERLRDRSREALMRDARALAAQQRWGASEVGKALGWPESTVRGWLGQAAPAPAEGVTAAAD